LLSKFETKHDSLRENAEGGSSDEVDVDARLLIIVISHYWDCTQVETEYKEAL